MNRGDIKGWMRINFSDIPKYVEYLNNWGFTRIIPEVGPAACETHLILYNDFYIFLFEPSNLPKNLEFVSNDEFENFVLFKSI